MRERWSRISPALIRATLAAATARGLWLRMQQAYDLWHAERALKKAVAKIPTAKARAA